MLIEVLPLALLWLFLNVCNGSASAAICSSDKRVLTHTRATTCASISNNNNQSTVCAGSKWPFIGGNMLPSLTYTPSPYLSRTLYSAAKPCCQCSNMCLVVLVDSIVGSQGVKCPVGRSVWNLWPRLSMFDMLQQCVMCGGRAVNICVCVCASVGHIMYIWLFFHL